MMLSAGLCTRFRSIGELEEELTNIRHAGRVSHRLRPPLLIEFSTPDNCEVVF